VKQDERSIVLKMKMREFGISLVNSQAREITYVFVKGLKYSHSST
jgi:hypothetical protein